MVPVKERPAVGKQRIKIRSDSWPRTDFELVQTRFSGIFEDRSIK